MDFQPRWERFRKALRRVVRRECRNGEARTVDNFLAQFLEGAASIQRQDVPRPCEQTVHWIHVGLNLLEVSDELRLAVPPARLRQVLAAVRQLGRCSRELCGSPWQRRPSPDLMSLVVEDRLQRPGAIMIYAGTDSQAPAWIGDPTASTGTWVVGLRSAEGQVAAAFEVMEYDPSIAALDVIPLRLPATSATMAVAPMPAGSLALPCTQVGEELSFQGVRQDSAYVCEIRTARGDWGRRLIKLRAAIPRQICRPVSSRTRRDKTSETNTT